MIKTKQFEVAVGWGQISGQIFGDTSAPNAKPILALHGFLDNSNRPARHGPEQ